MASIEQDDIFNVEDDMEEDEEEEQHHVGDYSIDEDHQPSMHQDQQEQNNDNEKVLHDDMEIEDEDGEEGEEEEGEEGEEEEEMDDEEEEEEDGEEMEMEEEEEDEEETNPEETNKQDTISNKENKSITQDQNQSNNTPILNDSTIDNSKITDNSQDQLDDNLEKKIPSNEEQHIDQDQLDQEQAEKEHSTTTFREQVINRAKKAVDFDIVPQVAIPYSSQCHIMAFTQGPKWILTGGEDGFIRKYDFIASIQGKSPLTMAQKHNLSDSITNAGVICSYWENEQPMSRSQLMKMNSKLKDSDFSTGSVSYEPKTNPVYALDVEKNGFWCLSGLLSGGISLYTMRHNEGSIHHYFHQYSKDSAKYKRGHKDAVSVIKLNHSQTKFLSGSWDKTIKLWDLNTGSVVTDYAGSSGQISNIQHRPIGLTDLTITTNKDPEQEPTKKVKNKEEDEDDIDSLFGDEENDKDTTDKQLENQDSPKINNGAQSKTYSNDSIFMSSSIDGTISIWDTRIDKPVVKLGVSENTPPWCMSSTWSNNGEFIYAGRRNGTVEEISIKKPIKPNTKNTPNVSKLLQFPKLSGPVSALSTMPNDDFLLCGSNDNIRLYNLTLYDEFSSTSTNVNSKKQQATPFLLIPGHHGGMLSQLYVDETGRFMVSSNGYRGWGHGSYTDTVLIYEIDFE